MVADNLMRRYSLPTRVTSPTLFNEKFDKLDNLPVHSNPNEDSAREQDLLKKGFKGESLEEQMLSLKEDELSQAEAIQIYSDPKLIDLTRERENIKAEKYAQEDLNSIRKSAYNFALNLGAEPRIADNFSTVIDWTPIIGDFAGFEDAVDNYKAGNYGTAAFDAALATVGLAPIAGDILKNIIKGNRKIKSKDPYYDSTEELDDGITLKIIAGSNVSDTSLLDKLGEFQAKRNVIGKSSDQGKNTGWTIIDGKPRFEISDANAEVNLKPVVGSLNTKFNVKRPIRDLYQSAKLNQETTLKEIFKHDELYKAYPELKDLRVIVNKTYDETGVLGSFGTGLDGKSELTIAPLIMIARATGNENVLKQTISGKGYNPVLDKFISVKEAHQLSLEEYKKTILHEIQHAIQRIEGLKQGSSIQTSKTNFMDWFDSLDPVVRDEYSQGIAAQMGVFENEISSANLPKPLVRYFYKNSAGEIESTVVEESHKLTTKQLKEVPLEDRFDEYRKSIREKANKDSMEEDNFEVYVEELDRFEDIVGYDNEVHYISDFHQKDALQPTYNLPFEDVNLVKNFIKKSFKKIPELKFLSKIKKGDTVTYKNSEYTFDKIIVGGEWDKDNFSFMVKENLVFNPLTSTDQLTFNKISGPTVRLRKIKPSSAKEIEKSGEDYIDIPILQVGDTLSKESEIILRKELSNLSKPKGLMSRLFKKD
tara:strand:- start:377 stop:2494 length:2118 start_codon:yes stop_codon:yes gene_type:complete